MSLVFNTNSDSIDKLPTDDNVVSHSELQLANVLFKEKQNFLSKVISGTKDVLFVIGLYLIFCMPQIDDLIKKFFPSSMNSIYIFSGIKAFLFGFSFFLIQNIHSVYKK